MTEKNGQKEQSDGSIMPRTRRVTAMLCAIMCTVCLSTCIGTGDGGSTSTASASLSATSTIPVGRLAASLSDYIAQTLNDITDDPDNGMSDAQRAILERAAQSGSISAADYESAWSAYTTCMTDRGYTAPVRIRYPNGFSTVASTDLVNATSERRAKFGADNTQCWVGEMYYISQVYQVQIGNPGLFKDTDEALADCFHKTGLVPDSYTKEQWKKEYEADIAAMDGSVPISEKYSIDINDPQIEGCLATAGYSFVDGSDPDTPIWNPF